MANLGRAGGEIDIRQGRDRNDHPLGRDNRKRADILRFGDPAARAFQHQVEPLVAGRDLRNEKPVIECVDRRTEFPGGHAVVRKLETVRDDTNLRRAEFKARLGAELVALVERQDSRDLGRRPPGS